MHNPYVTNNILRHDIGDEVYGEAPCGVKFNMRIHFPGFEPLLCAKCFPVEDEAA